MDLKNTFFIFSIHPLDRFLAFCILLNMEILLLRPHMASDSKLRKYDMSTATMLFFVYLGCPSFKDSATFLFCSVFANRPIHTIVRFHLTCMLLHVSVIILVVLD